MHWLETLVVPSLRGSPGNGPPPRPEGPALAYLDFNESPSPPFGACTALPLNRYPRHEETKLKDAMASFYGVKPENLLVVSGGSAKAIDYTIKAFCYPGIDNILTCPPTFELYDAWARFQTPGPVGTSHAPLDPAAGYQLDLTRIADNATAATKLIFIPTPNAPMGHMMDETLMRQLAAARRGTSVVVADEAYAEFSPHPQGLIPALKDHDNLLILRTMSKYHALAGARIGVVIGDPAVLAKLDTLRGPFSLPAPSIDAALHALSPYGLHQSEIRHRRIIEERARLAEALKKHPDVEEIFPSAANFLFVRVSDAEAFTRKAADGQVAVRNSNHNLKNGVRITVGTRHENDRLMRALAQRTAAPT